MYDCLKLLSVNISYDKIKHMLNRQLSFYRPKQ